MSLNEYIGQQIKKARRLARMTQKELGERLGKSGATIAYLEQGKRRVAPNILEQIAAETNQPLAYFFEHQGDDHSVEMKQQLHELKQQLHQLSDLLNQAEQRALDSEITAQLVFDEAMDALILMAASGRILKVNKAYLELLELREEEVVGRMFWEIQLADPQTIEAYKKGFFAAIEKGEVTPLLRHPMTSRSGKKIMVETASRMLKKEGRPWAMFCSLRPVQDAKEMEGV